MIEFCPQNGRAFCSPNRFRMRVAVQLLLALGLLLPLPTQLAPQAVLQAMPNPEMWTLLASPSR